MSVCNVVKSLDNSLVFMFMKEYVLEKILMNGLSKMKPLQTFKIFIIMKLFILDRNSVNVSNVVKPVCYGIHWVPTQFKHQDNPNDKSLLVVNLLLINQDHKNILRSLAIDFCLYFLVSHVSNNFSLFISSRTAFQKFWFTYAYDYVIVN